MKLYASEGRPSIPPEQLLSALLLQAFYAIRSERQLMEQLDHDLLYRWFVGLAPDKPVWDATAATAFTKNREHLRLALQRPCAVPVLAGGDPFDLKLRTILGDEALEQLVRIFQFLLKLVASGIGILANKVRVRLYWPAVCSSKSTLCSFRKRLKFGSWPWRDAARRRRGILAELSLCLVLHRHRGRRRHAQRSSSRKPGQTGAKVGVFDTELRTQLGEAPETRDGLRRQLPSNIFVQFLAGPGDIRKGGLGLILKLIAWFSLVIGPVLLLFLIQAQFLLYHLEWVTWGQRVAIVVDVVLLWLLWPAVLSGRSKLMWRLERRGKGWPGVLALTGRYIAGLTACFIPIGLAFTAATFPGEGMDEWIGERQWLPQNPVTAWLGANPEKAWFNRMDWTSLHELLFNGEVDEVTGRRKSPFSNTLVLPAFDALKAAKIDDPKKLDALKHTLNLRGRHLEGVNFFGADLRKVDLEGAQLQGAALAKAQLQGATLDNAQLQGVGANFAQLQGASLKKAHFQGSYLVFTHLQGAALDEAQLQGVLIGAKLQGASLAGAQLQGANFQGSRLVGTRMDGAHVWRTNFENASFDRQRGRKPESA